MPALTHDVRQSKVFCDIPPAVHGWIILQSGVPVLKPAGRHAGNKVWYTTMGAKDIIGHAISASAGSLPSKIRVGRAHDLHLWSPLQACQSGLKTCVWADDEAPLPKSCLGRARRACFEMLLGSA